MLHKIMESALLSLEIKSASEVSSFSGGMSNLGKVNALQNIVIG